MAEARKRLDAVKRRFSSKEDSDVGERLDSLRQRVTVLEREVQENRELNRRIAELTDVVTELLIPISDRDPAKVDAILDKYRNTL